MPALAMGMGIGMVRQIPHDFGYETAIVQSSLDWLASMYVYKQFRRL